MRVAIVGGGIAGLAAAHAIRAQVPDAEIVVLEARDRVGGNIRSETIGGYLCEAGPDGFLDNAPATLAFVESIGLTPRLLPSRDEARRRYIFRAGRLHEVPMSPAAVLAGMRDNPRRGFDQVIVKGFINLVGIYPVGTLVVLDTFELAIVHSVTPNPQAISRPVVRIVSDDRGNILYPGEMVDLTEQASSGVFRRTIITTEQPERYGLTVGDYFL